MSDYEGVAQMKNGQRVIAEKIMDKFPGAQITWTEKRSVHYCHVSSGGTERKFHCPRELLEDIGAAPDKQTAKLFQVIQEIERGLSEPQK